MAYVINCKEIDRDDGQVGAYVLPQGSNELETIQQMMVSRAEEFIDERVELDIENGGEVGSYELIIHPTRTSVQVLVTGNTTPLIDMLIVHVDIN